MVPNHVTVHARPMLLRQAFFKELKSCPRNFVPQNVLVKVPKRREWKDEREERLIMMCQWQTGKQTIDSFTSLTNIAFGKL